MAGVLAHVPCHLLDSSGVQRKMRLLNTTSLQFWECFDRRVPPYAILSHRWGHEEVTFNDMRHGRSTDGSGYDKIRHSCAIARSRKLEWIWVDTCCIDKRSSAELSEAINSMFYWCQRSKERYVHMSDVPNVSVRDSKWFSRGWTLQELLAPRDVLFFDSDWKPLGTKADSDMQWEIYVATGINEAYLSFEESIDEASVAQRMHWISRRETTRVEDLAYCTLGIFDVQMPLLYGEGEKAFMRLQQEIVKKSTDESIFAWTWRESAWKGLLAPSPKAFSHSGRIVAGQQDRRLPYFMTHKGMEFRSTAQRTSFQSNTAWRIFIVKLNCFSEPSEDDDESEMPYRCAIVLIEHHGNFSRMHLDNLGNNLETLYPAGRRQETGHMRFYIHQNGL